MQDLKQKVLENLKTKGYHEYQLKELNPIIQATIEATKQALNIPYVIKSVCKYGMNPDDCIRKADTCFDCLKDS